MKKLFLACIVPLFFISVTTPTFAAETKKVCVDVKDKDGKVAKDGKGNPKQSCKEVKVHKKLDGEKIPEKKK